MTSTPCMSDYIFTSGPKWNIHLEISRKKRKNLSGKHLSKLLHFFELNPMPSKEARIAIAKKIPGMTERSVQVWFQNRRSKLNMTTSKKSKKSGTPESTLEEENQTHGKKQTVLKQSSSMDEVSGEEIEDDEEEEIESDEETSEELEKQQVVSKTKTKDKQNNLSSSPSQKIHNPSFKLETNTIGFQPVKPETQTHYYNSWEGSSFNVVKPTLTFSTFQPHVSQFMSPSGFYPAISSPSSSTCSSTLSSPHKSQHQDLKFDTPTFSYSYPSMDSIATIAKKPSKQKDNKIEEKKGVMSVSFLVQ